MPVSGPSPYATGKGDSWAWDALYSGYTPPESPDVEPTPYAPDTVSRYLGGPQSLGGSTLTYAVPFGQGMHPTTTYADVADQATRAQQRRERGTAQQPKAQQQAESPAPPAEQAQAAQEQMQKQQKQERVNQAKAKIVQAQKDRQEREQVYAGARDATAKAQEQVQHAQQELDDAQNDLDDAEESGQDTSDLEDAVDEAKDTLNQAKNAYDGAKAAEVQAQQSLQEAIAGEDTANKELQTAEQDLQSSEQQAQQAQEQADQQKAQEQQAAPSPYGDQQQPSEGGQVQTTAEQLTEGLNPEPGQQQQASQDPIQQAVEQVKAAGGDADMLLTQVATRAWQQQTGKQAPDWMNPDEVKAFDEYRESWKGAFRAGQNVPLANELRDAASRAGAPRSAPNPNLVGGLDRPPLAGPGASPSPQPGTLPLPGAGAPRPTGTPNPALSQAQDTLAAAQARDAKLRDMLRAAGKDVGTWQDRLGAAQEQAKQLSNEYSLGIGSDSYRQFSLGPALNAAQGDASDAAQQLAKAQQKQAQANQMLGTSAEAIAAGQNLVKLAQAQQPTPADLAGGPADLAARQASEAAEAGKLLDTLLARATPEQRQALAGDIVSGGQAGTEVLRKIAEAAWYRQLADKGLPSPAGGPPQDYVQSWLGMFRAGQTGAPLIKALRDELERRGVGGGATNAPVGGGAQAATVGGGALAARGPAESVLGPQEQQQIAGLNPQQRQMYDEWMANGGSGRLEDFQKHAQALGAPVPGLPEPTTPANAGPVGSVLAQNLLGKGAPNIIQQQIPTTTGTYPTQLPPEQRRLWDEWKAAGGSGDWESFRQHAIRVGAPDLGAAPNQVLDSRDRGVPAGQAGPPTTTMEKPRSADVVNQKPPSVVPQGTDVSTLLRPGVAPKPGAQVAPASPGSQLAVTSGLGPDFDPIVVSGAVAGVRDEQGQQTIANGVSAWLRGDPNAAWAQNHVENAAKIAWWLQNGKQPGSRPEDAPQDYVASWVDNFRKGDTSSPLQAEMNQALKSRGLMAPSDMKASGWNPVLGQRIAQENFFGDNPARQQAMVDFQKLSPEVRRQIFENAMDQGLTAEGINDPQQREVWKQTMRLMTMGSSEFPGENRDLNPFMLAGESGGHPGNATRLNSSALGYFQFLAQNRDGSDYGHWSRYSPTPNDRSQMTNPTTQVRQYIRSVNLGSAHGDPWSYIEQKRRTHVWGP